MIKKLTSVCVLSLLLFLPRGQAQNALPIIEYKWGDGQLTGIMPFDQAFSLKITGMPSTIENLDITLYEIRKNYNLFPDGKKKKPKKITYEEFVGMPWMRVYSMAPWKQQPGKTDTFAFIHEDYPLHPNSQYVIEVKAHTREELSDAQQEQIKEKIEGSDKIGEVLNNFARTFGLGLRPFHDLKPLIEPLNKAIQTELSTIDTTYIFKPTANELTELQDVADFVTSIRNLRQKVKELTNSGDTSNPQVKIDRAAAAALAKTISNIDFGQFVFDADSRADFTAGAAKLVKTGIATYDNKIDLVNAGAATIAEKADNIIKTVIPDLVIENTFIITAQGGNYPAALSDQANNYLGLDFGLAYVGNFSRIQSYYGLNVYFRPINKNIPVGRYVKFGDIIGTRLSLLLGVTFASVEKDNIRKGVLGDKGLMVGAGFRLLSFLRIQSGMLLYYRYPTNPLANKDNYTLRPSPFFSLSFDLSMQDLLGVFGSSFFPPKTPATTTTTTTP